MCSATAESAPSRRYLIALGSNQRHAEYGLPAQVIIAAINALRVMGLNIFARSDIISSRPIGPSRRQYANAVLIAKSKLAPLELLELLQQTEQQFGARRGQPWGRRVLDLDIILWDGGMFVGTPPALTIPHPLFRQRPFVLEPAREIAAHWRDPLSGRTIAQLARHREAYDNRPKKRAKLLDQTAKRY